MKDSNIQSIFLEILSKYQHKNKTRFLVLMGGCSRSGKTTLANVLKKSFHLQGIPSIIVSLDNWVMGINERTGKETVRDRYNYAAIFTAVKMIMNGERIFPPLYDPITRLVNRCNNTYFHELDYGIIVADGVIALDIPELRNLSSYNIYVHLKDKIRKERLFEFYHQNKKCSYDECNKIINSREAEEVPVIKETKRFADSVIELITSVDQDMSN